MQHTFDQKIGIAYSQRYLDLGLPKNNNDIITLRAIRVSDQPNSRHAIFSEEGTIIKVKTGVALSIPEGYVGEIFVDRQFSVENKTHMISGVGLLTPGTPFEVIVTLITHGNYCRIDVGQVVAQLVLRRIYMQDYEPMNFDFGKEFVLKKDRFSKS